jgi:hypothetical protein
LLHEAPINQGFGAGWSSPVARQAHNLKVVGSNPTPATKIRLLDQSFTFGPTLFHARPSRLNCAKRESKEFPRARANPLAQSAGKIPRHKKPGGTQFFCRELTLRSWNCPLARC